MTSSATLAFGSSPHTRGARAVRRRGAASPRIIPAYAGSTPNIGASGMRNTDHPRIRGEHWQASPATWRHSGSSPHTRGAPVKSEVRSSGARIIPAYAGST